jgi:adenylosuccinate lyase
MRDPINSISPLDGRYGSKVEDLRAYFSESALMKYRVLVEVEWFIFLSNHLKLKGTRVWKPMELKEIRSLYEFFDDMNANRVKTIEETTNHDVKAIEYFIKENLKGSVFEDYLEFVHFGCTSEDINNLAYALMLKGALQNVVTPLLTGLTQLIYQMGKKYKNVPMMSRTHGQPATPTTMGKELINFLVRIKPQIDVVQSIPIKGKMNGAVGNFNAHVVAYPKVKWIEASNKFIQQLGLTASLHTTQIEPHDFMAGIFDALRRINTIVMDMDRDIWTYISLGYFKQRLRAGEVGSSTMPHKVNPIDFENSEGNLGMANAMLCHFSEKLPLSRLQRDLTDSTVLRNIGSAMGYCVLAYKNCIQGLHKLELNAAAISHDLDSNWELLAEPIQMMMRRYGIEKPYEKLKELTRGKKIDKQTIHKFIGNLKIPAQEKKRLKALTPSTYIGLASELVDLIK